MGSLKWGRKFTALRPHQKPSDSSLKRRACTSPKNCQSLGDCWNTICSKRPVLSRGLPQNPVFSTGFETVKEIGLNSSLRKSIVVPLGYLKHLKTSPWKIPNSWMVGKSKNKKDDLGVPPFWETFICSSHEVICFEALLFSCPKTKSHWLTDMQR